MIPRREFLKIGGLTVAVPGFVRGVFAQSGTGTTKLENLTAGVKPLGPEDYTERRERAARLMTTHNLDAVFLPGGVNLSYFTTVSWGSSERTFGAILNKKGLPIWVCPAFELERAKESIPAGQDVRTWEEHESPYKLIGGIVKDLGGRRIGVAPNTAGFQIFGLKRDAPSVELADGAVVTDGCRGTKTAKEIAYMDLAARITKLAYRQAFGSIREGLTPRDVSAAISAAHTQMGASGGGGPQFGPNTAFPHGSRTPRTVSDGTVVMVDGGCGIEGYRSDVTRTIVFGKPTEKMIKVWDIVKKAQTAALKACRPGAACEDVDIASRKVIEDAGFGPGYKYFAHRLGHGIGLEGHEYPYLVRDNKLKLEPGMTFSNEPGIYIYGEFGIRHEDCMVVTENGARYLGGMEALAIDRPFAEQ
jgi:Xaa-Pro dipeptidase